VLLREKAEQTIHEMICIIKNTRGKDSFNFRLMNDIWYVAKSLSYYLLTIIFSIV
jgi:hypothetical protein